MAKIAVTRYSFVTIVSLFFAQGQYGIPPSSTLDRIKGTFLCRRSFTDETNQVDQILDKHSTLAIPNRKGTDVASPPVTSSQFEPQSSSSAYYGANTSLMKTSAKSTQKYTRIILNEGSNTHTNQMQEEPSTPTLNRQSSDVTSQRETSFTTPKPSSAYDEATSNLMKTSSHSPTLSDNVTVANQIHEELSTSNVIRYSSDVTSQSTTSWSTPKPSYAHNEATTVVMKTSVSSSKPTVLSTEGIFKGDAGSWTFWGNSSYSFVNESEVKWDEAVEECSFRAQGAHLVFIETEEEDVFISGMLEAITPSNAISSWWIGLNDKGHEDLWKWYDIPANYTNWANNEPNDGILSLLSENCVTLSSLVNWRWVDVGCEIWTFKYICELDGSI